MRSSLRLATLLLLLTPACTVPSDPDVPLDAGRDAPRSDTPLPDAGVDGGPVDAPGMDAPAVTDTGIDAPESADVPTLDVPAVDAGSDAGIDAAGTDAGPLPPTIDGTISPGEWAGAVVATDDTITIWSGNELRGLRALIAGDSLYLALEGRIEGGNAMAVYVDRDLDEAVGVADLSTVTDFEGALDNAITGALVTPTGFATDLVFGTLDLSRSASGSDARMGWRDLNRAAALDDLYWIGADVAPVVCASATCETRLPLDELGGTAPRRIALFARILNADGTMSPNQTLPSDDGAMPRTVAAVLELAE